MKLKLVLIAILGMSLAGCAIVPTKDKEAFAKVKKVAVVGYTMDYNQDVGTAMGQQFMGGESKNHDGTKVENKAYETPVSKAAYDNIVKTLRQMKWTVVEGDKVITSNSLRAFREKNIKWGQQPLQARHDRLERYGVPQYHHMGALVGKKESPLQSIATELGVDALAFVYVETNILFPVSMGALGMGKASYASRMIVDIYSPEKNHLVNRVYVSGEEAKQAEGSKAFATGSTEANSFGGFERASARLVPALQKPL